MTIKNHKAIQEASREYTAREVIQGSGIYRVTNSNNSKAYDVTINDNGATCTCPWGEHRPETDKRSGCKHVIAAYEAHEGRRVYAHANEVTAKTWRKQTANIGDGMVITFA